MAAKKVKAKAKAKSPKQRKPQGEKQHAIAKKKKHTTKKNPNFIPLGNNPLLAEKKKKETRKEEESNNLLNISTISSSEQLKFFLHHFQSANGFKLSSLELEAFKDTCMVELSGSMDQDADHFSEHMKTIFETSWKDALCDGKLIEGKVDAGCPAVIVISTSALRSLELLRGLRPLTKECRPAKLFAKHMKVDEQATLLKGRVNIACGSPSRIKKLIDMDALFLSRLGVIVLDMQRDAKGYSLFSLPQVCSEFWDLYKSHFNERLLQGHTRICFYGAVPCAEIDKICQSGE